MPNANDIDSLTGRLWRVPVYLPYLQDRLTDEALVEAEARLGLKLPVAYVAVLRHQNGGYLHLGSHPAGSAVEILPGIGDRFPSIFDQTASRQIGFGGNGRYFYALDYRDGGPEGEPCVRYIDLECGVDELVAPNFAEFLQQLHAPHEDAVFALATLAPMEEVVAQVARASGFEFGDQGDHGNGYRVFHARLHEPTYTNAFITANRVRRGFVRPSDPRYPELKDWMPETVLRYPEFPDCGYFIKCDGERRNQWSQSFMDAIESADLPFERRLVYRHGEPQEVPSLEGGMTADELQAAIDELNELLNDTEQ